MQKMNTPGWSGPVKLEDIQRADMYRDYLANWSSVVGGRSSVKGENSKQKLNHYTDHPPLTTDD